MPLEHHKWDAQVAHAHALRGRHSCARSTCGCSSSPQVSYCRTGTVRRQGGASRAYTSCCRAVIVALSPAIRGCLRYVSVGTGGWSRAVIRKTN